jgi:O-antigen/teichoic acid export membrane protein
MASYRKKALFGVGYLTFLSIISQCITLIKLSILARLLTPADFGLFAIVTTTITTFETLTDTGFNYAAIHLGIDIEKIAKTLLSINIVRGAALSLIMLILAPLISYFFSYPNLLPLMVIASVIPLLRGFINPHTISFQKEMEFNKVFIIQFIPIAANAIFSIILVFRFHSALALLLGLTISTIIEVIFSYFIASTNLKEPINKEYIKNLFSYGKWITAGGLLTYLGTQIDNIFIGKFLGAAYLGLYDFAFRTANIAFTQITDTVSQVAFPLYSIRQADKQHLRELFVKNIMAVSFPALLICLPFLFFPKFILFVLFGEKWINAAPTLQILAVYGFIRASIGPIGPLFLSIGKPDVLTKTNILNFLLIIILIYPLLNLLGLPGVALAMTISYLITAPVYIIETIKYFRK